MSTLLTTQKAPVLDQDGNQLGVVGQTLYTVTSSAPGVASVNWNNWKAEILGVSAGTATITAVRLLDNQSASLDVTVEAPVLNPFSISLGAPVDK